MLQRVALRPLRPLRGVAGRHSFGLLRRSCVSPPSRWSPCARGRAHVRVGRVSARIRSPVPSPARCASQHHAVLGVVVRRSRGALRRGSLRSLCRPMRPGSGASRGGSRASPPSDIPKPRLGVADKAAAEHRQTRSRAPCPAGSMDCAVSSFAASPAVSGIVHSRCASPRSTPYDGVSAIERPRPEPPGTSFSDPDTPHSRWLSSACAASPYTRSAMSRPRAGSVKPTPAPSSRPAPVPASPPS